MKVVLKKVLKNKKAVSIIEQGSYSGCNFLFAMIVYKLFGDQSFVDFSNALILTFLFLGVHRSFISLPLTINKKFNSNFYFFFSGGLYVLCCTGFLFISYFTELFEFNYFVFTIIFCVFSYELSRRILYRINNYRLLIFISLVPFLSLILILTLIFFKVGTEKVIISTYYLVLSLPVLILFKMSTKSMNTTLSSTYFEYKSCVKVCLWNFCSGLVYSSYNQLYYLFLSSKLTASSMAVIYLLRNFFQPIQVLLSAFDSVDKNKYRVASSFNDAFQYLKKSTKHLLALSVTYCALLMIAFTVYPAKSDYTEDTYSFVLLYSFLYILMSMTQPVESLLTTYKKSFTVFKYRLFGASILLMLAQFVESNIALVSLLLVPWLISSILCHMKVKGLKC